MDPNQAETERIERMERQLQQALRVASAEIRIVRAQNDHLITQLTNLRVENDDLMAEKVRLQQQLQMAREEAQQQQQQQLRRD